MSRKKLLSVIDSIEWWAKNRPEAAAIESEASSISYNELKVMSDYLAMTLRRRCKKSKRVLILMPRSPEMIIAILAALKANIPFSTIAINSPEQRLLRIVEIANPDLVLTCDRCSDAEILTKIGLSEKNFGVSIENLKNKRALNKKSGYASRSDESYIFFTSGSTGEPKAIMGSYKGLCQFIEWQSKTFNCDQKTRVSFLTAIGFDPSLRDIFLPLVNGGVCVIPDENTILNLERFSRWLHEKRISHVHIVPTLFREYFVKNEFNFKNSNLKVIFLAGEVLRSQDVAPLYKRPGFKVRLVNLYGPTETTLAKFYNIIDKNDLLLPVIPVGYPIDFAKGFVLDGKLKVVEKNAIGDLYIHTPYQSLGYLNAPDLNKKLFLKDILLNGEKLSLYKTGDVARRLPNGKIQVLGRKDNQIKINGVRVEIGEIENAILKCNEVREVAVIYHALDNGQKILSAHYVGGISPGDLQKFLTSYLPRQAIPQKLIAIAKLPRLPNGKIARMALLSKNELPPNKAGVVRTEKATTIEAKTATEVKLLKVFQTLFGEEKINFSDNFLALGGNSIQAMQLRSLIERTFNVSLEVSDIFSSKNLAAIVSEIDKLRLLAGESIKLSTTKKSRLRKVSRGNLVSPSYFQETVLEMVDRDPRGYLIMRAYDVTSSIYLKRFKKSVELTVSRHEILRAAFTKKSGKYKLKAKKSFANYFRFVNLSSLSGAKQNKFLKKRIGELEQRICDLGRDRLFGCDLWQHSKTRHTILIWAHHLIFDGVSFEIVLREISKNYETLSSESKRKSLEQPVQFADFATWERENAKKVDLEQTLKRIETNSKQFQWQYSQKVKAQKNVVERSFHVRRLGRKTCDALREFRVSGGYSLNSIFLAAIELAFAEATRRHKFLTLIQKMARTEPELNGVLGPIIDLSLQKCEVASNSNFNSHVRTVQARFLKTLSNEIVSFFKLFPLTKESEVFCDAYRPQLYFNFLDFESLSFNNLPAINIDLPYSTDGARGWGWDCDVVVLMERSNDTYVCTLSCDSKTFGSFDPEDLLNRYFEILANTESLVPNIK